MFRSILLFCLIEKCREVESEWGQLEMEEMDRQGKELGWGHVLSVTSGSMHYIVQDELSNATFMYICICLSCVCVWGGAGETGSGWGLSSSTSKSPPENNPKNMKFTTRWWKCEKTHNSPCVCNFVFLTPPRCASLPSGLTSASFLRIRSFSTTPSATTSSTAASRRAGRSWRGLPWLQTYTAGSWSYHRVRLGCVNMEHARINMLFGTNEGEL